MEKNKISIVVPCFNEKEALPLFYNKITQVFDQMSQESETAGLYYELIIVLMAPWMGRSMSRKSLPQMIPV